MNRRSLYYASLVYEESAKDNWVGILENLHIPCLISPLHNSDIDEHGNILKPHWHILFLFETLKSRQQFSEIVEQIGSVGCEIIHCPKSYGLYLTHKNAPQKFQYDPNEIISLSGGADYLSKITISSINKYDVISEIIRFCQSEHIDCLADIIEFALDNNESWFHVLAEGSSSIMLTNYLKSRTWRTSRSE
ncbi:MAG: replication protein [Lachnospiraceae bacterium]|nr:replication protein [Lachnospiraceae bacterium]